MHPCLSAEVSHIQLSYRYAADIVRCPSSAQETHSHAALSEGSGQRKVPAVAVEVKAAAQGERLTCLSHFSFSSQQLRPQKPLIFLSYQMNFSLHK